MNKIVLGLFLSFIFNQSLNSQSTFLEKYKDYPEVNLLEKDAYKISIKKGAVYIEKESYRETIITSEMGLKNDEEFFYHSSLIPVAEYEAYTLTKAGKKIKVSQISESSGKDNYVFHDDVKKTKFSYSGIEIGAKKILRYKTIYKDPSLLNGMSFIRVEPCQKIVLEVSCSKDVEISFKTINDNEKLIHHSKKEDGDNIIYTWTRENIAPTKFESNTPDYRYFSPHVLLYIKSYKVKDKVVPYLGSPDLLYKLYTEYIKNLNVTDDENLKQFTINLVKDITDEEEKVKRIYYWVKQNIKYIAFESGYEGFIPRQASNVFERKYGDCKDMASIITSMCKYANIPNVNLTWIGTRDIPYSYSEMPTPACDNHMIATYTNSKNEIIFLDATDNQSKYGYPSSFIQGKEALMDKNKNGYSIVKVPIVEASKNKIERIAELSINGKKIQGKAKLASDGYYRANMIKNLSDASGQDRYEKIKSITLLGNNKYNLINFDEVNLSDIDKPYEISFNFDINNYLVSTGDETYINMALIKPLEKEILEKDRQFDYEIEFLGTIKNSFALEIPPSKDIKSLPSDFNFDNDVLQSQFKYTKKDNKVILDYEIKTKKLLLQKNDFHKWNEGISQLKKQYNEVLVLKNKS